MANWNTLMSFACSPNIPCGLRHNVKRRANRKQHVSNTRQKLAAKKNVWALGEKESKLRQSSDFAIPMARPTARLLVFNVLCHQAETCWDHLVKSIWDIVIVLLLNSYDVVPLSEIRNLMLCWLMNVEYDSQNIFFLEIRQLFWPCFDLVYIFFVSFIFTEEEGQVSAV